MKKNKPQISAKAQYFKKKKEMPSGVDDLATHQEQEMQQQQQPQQIQVIEQQSSEEEVELREGPDVEEQSRFLLGLIQKNKLNEKNSFEVPFIDLRNLKAFNQTEEVESWKEISAFLDASSRVYGFRVDFIHHNSLKIIAALHRAKKTDKEDEQQEEQENNKKKIQNPDGENTLEKYPSNLETNKFELENEIDPLFQQTSALFDEGSCRGFLLRNLRISEDLVVSFDTELIPEKKELSEFDSSKYPDIVNKIANERICPEFVEVKEAVLGKKGFRNYIQEEMDQGNYEVLDNNLEIPDFSLNYNTQMQIISKNKNTQIEEQRQTQRPFNVGNFEKTVSRLGTGRLFENEREKAQFIQPDLRQVPKRFVQPTKAQEKPRSKKRCGLTFSFDITEEEELDRETILQAKEKEDYCTQKEPLTQLNLLPKSYLIDQQNFDSPYQIPSFPKWDEAPPPEQIEEQNDIVQEEFYYFGAVAQQYATRSRLIAEHLKKNQNGKLNIPIRVLKAKIWETYGDKIPFEKEKIGISFRHVIKNLPKILKIDRSRGTVSYQTIFVTMLHLANEYGLIFKQRQDGKGFIIQKEDI